MKLELTLVIDCGDLLINPEDQDERDFLFDILLIPENLALISNENGDEIGTITEVKDAKII